MSVGSDEDRDLRAWRAAYRELQQPGSEACPADERLAELVADELAVEDRLGLADHVAGCRRCSETLRDLLELDRESNRRRASSYSGAPPLWRRPLAWAASVLLVAALAIVAGRFPSTSDEGLRSNGDAAGVSPAPGAELDGVPRLLSWPAAPAEAGARVRLFDARGELVWERVADAAGRVELPDEVGGRLRGGESYFWVVEGGAPDGRRRGPYWFRLDARR